VLQAGDIKRPTSAASLVAVHPASAFAKVTPAVLARPKRQRCDRDGEKRGGDRRSMSNRTLKKYSASSSPCALSRQGTQATTAENFVPKLGT
jgi:hypothetical protein